MGRVRLIATDLDGTLLRSDGTVSDFTRATLSRAREAGVTVVLVSARGPRGVVVVAEDAGLATGTAICANGAVVIDLARHEVLLHRPLPSEIAAEIVHALRRRLPDVCFAVETEWRFALERAFEGAWDGWMPPEETTYGDALDLVSAPVTKLIARDATRSNDELAGVAAEIVGDRAVVSHGGVWAIEITVTGVSKGAALTELGAELGIAAEEVLAFGDYPNDLPMLAWAGRSVAPRNAHPDVLAAVDEVTESNDDDGVARALERVLGI